MFTKLASSCISLKKIYTQFYLLKYFHDILSIIRAIMNRFVYLLFYTYINCWIIQIHSVDSILQLNNIRNSPIYARVCFLLHSACHFMRLEYKAILNSCCSDPLRSTIWNKAKSLTVWNVPHMKIDKNALWSGLHTYIYIYIYRCTYKN